MAIGLVALLTLVSAGVLSWGAWHFFIAANPSEQLASLPEKKAGTSEGATSKAEEPNASAQSKKKESLDIPKSVEPTRETTSKSGPSKVTKTPDPTAGVMPKKEKELSLKTNTPDIELKNDIKKSEENNPKKEAPLTLGMTGLIAKLQTGTEDEKGNALAELSELGLEARSAARAICEVAASSPKDLSRNALLALDKVAPELKEPVFVLLIDNQATNHIKAIQRLTNIGLEQAKFSVIGEEKF